MTRTKENSSKSPRELLHASKDTKLQAKKTALSLIEKALSAHILSSADNFNILRALCSSMSLQETELSKLWKTRTHSSTESGTSTAKKGGRSNSFDDHDEICEVCEKGGDLLCCDTCTLVFHLKCIRPKLSVVPKGHWSCPHCIIEDLADGDVRAAKKSLRSMNRLARGIDSDDDSGFTATGGAEAADPMRVSQLGEYSIVRKGKKFVLRKAEHKQIVDIGKYLSLEEALNYIKEEQYNIHQEAEKVAAAEAAKKAPKRTIPHSSSSSSLQKRRRGNDSESHPTSDLAEDALGTEVDGRGVCASTCGSEEGVSPRRSVSGGSLAVQESVGDSASSGSQEEGTSTNSYDELWCTHCMDDKGVTICAFCGCKKCYGKYDSNLLILCDYCDRETHTYCLDPPISAVPEEDPWYCQSCTAEGVPNNMSDNEEEEEDGEEGIEGAGGRGGRGGGGNGVYDESGSEADSEENGRRGVGRPARMKRSGSYSSTTSVVDSQGSFDEPNDGTVVYKKWGRGFKKVLSGISDPKISEDGKRGKYQTKAILAAAAAAQQQLLLQQQQAQAKQHRGRGRPPGSGKRVVPTTTGLLTDYSHSYSHVAVRAATKFLPPPPPPSSIEARGRKSSISSSMSGGSSHGNTSAASVAAAAVADYKLKSKLQAKSYLAGGWTGGDHLAGNDGIHSQDYSMGGQERRATEKEEGTGGAQASSHHQQLGGDEEGASLNGASNENENEEEDEVAEEEEVFELGAPGLASALRIVARASTVRGKVDGGPWADAELDHLDYVRGWAPVQDLSKVLAALHEQKDILVKRIMGVEPGFSCKEMEASIAAQFAEARAAAAALAATAMVSASLNSSSAGAGAVVGSAGQATATAAGGAPVTATKPRRPKAPKSTPGAATATVATTGAKTAAAIPAVTGATKKTVVTSGSAVNSAAPSTTIAAGPGAAPTPVPAVASPMTHPSAVMTASLTQKVGTPHVAPAVVKPQPAVVVAIPASSNNTAPENLVVSAPVGQSSMP